MNNQSGNTSPYNLNCGSAGRSGGSSGGEHCLDDNGAGHGEPRLETVGLVVGESWSVRVRLVVSLVEALRVWATTNRPNWMWSGLKISDSLHLPIH